MTTGLPLEVAAFIQARGSITTRPLATSLASQATAIDGVELRDQRSMKEASYFRIHHIDHPEHAVAYVTVRPSDLAIDYRLPWDFERAGRGEGRNNRERFTYGLRLVVRTSDDLPEAMRLLTEAISFGQADHSAQPAEPQSRGYWGIRTDTANNTDYIWRELRQGRLRQGWGRRPVEDLNVIEQQLAEGKALDEWQQQTWRGNRRLLSTQSDGVQVGDLAVLPHVAGHGTWTVVRITGQYRFSIDDGRNSTGAPDFGHILPVDVVTDPIPWRDPAHTQALVAAMRQRLRMWSLAGLADEVDALARKFGR